MEAEAGEIRRSGRQPKLTDKAAAAKRDREEREQPSEATTTTLKVGDEIKCFYKFEPPQKAIWLNGVIYEVNNKDDGSPATYSVKYDEDGQVDRNRPARMIRYRTDTNNAPPSRPLLPDCVTLEEDDEDNSSTKSVPSNTDDSSVPSTESPTKRAKVTSPSLGNSEGDTDMELTDTRTTESATLPKSGGSTTNSSSTNKSPDVSKKPSTHKVISLQDKASLEAAYGKVPPGKTASSRY